MLASTNQIPASQTTPNFFVLEINVRNSCIPGLQFQFYPFYFLKVPGTSTFQQNSNSFGEQESGNPLRRFKNGKTNLKLSRMELINKEGNLMG